MKFSSKVQKCGLSPMRKFHPYAVAAEAKGRKIYHLNIGQPDIETPKAYFEAVRHFDLPVLEYAPSPGMPVLIDAIRHYYDKLDMHFDAGDILITNGGSEALQIALQLHSRRRRRDPDSRALLSQLQHHGAHLRRVHPPHSHQPPTRATATPTGPGSRRRSTSIPGPS